MLLYTIHTFHYQSLIQIYKVDKNYSENKNILSNVLKTGQERTEISKILLSANFDQSN